MKKIYVFGRGIYFEEKFSQINDMYQIVGFLDNAVQDEDVDSRYNYPVYNPKHLDTLPQYDILIVSSYFIAMWKQLKMQGIDDERILFANAIKPLQLGMEAYAFANGEELTASGDKIIYRLESGDEYCFDSEEEFKEVLRSVNARRYPSVNLFSQLPLKPFSRVFGSERGRAVDRFYIEKFLEENKEDIQGICMEIGTDMYMKKYGGNRVSVPYILHVEGYGNSLKGNFETGEGIEENMVDCLICTQTLQYIYDLHTAMKNICKMLKPNGVALITVPGIKSLCLFDDKNWGEKWSFTEHSITNLCKELGDKVSFSARAYGNVKTATAYLYGICYEELAPSDFEYNDSQFPFLIVARIQKNV